MFRYDHFSDLILSLRRTGRDRGYTPFRNHCYGGRVALCPFYDQYFDLHSEPYWRSVGSKEDVDEVIDGFFTPIPDVKDPIIHALYSVLGSLDKFVGEATPLSAEGAASVLPSNTSPGFPYANNGYLDKGSCKDKILRDYKKSLNETVETRNFNVPCKAGLRLALAKKPRNKPRVVWVYPATVQLAEAKYFMPIYKQLYHCKYFSWDFSFLRGGFEEIRYWMNPSFCHYGTDVSSFDSTVSATLIDIIFRWMKSKFRMTWKQAREFDAVHNYFVNTPLWYQNHIFLKRRGVPSGSFFTQLVDSIVNLSYQLAVARTLLESPVLRLDQAFAFIRVLGDDSLCSLKRRQEFATLANFRLACEELLTSGIEIHSEKGYFCNRVTRENMNLPEYLGFSFPIGMPRLYPILRKSVDLVHAQCLFPESQEKDPGFSFARLVGIKWSSGDDPATLAVVNSYFELLTERYPDITPGSLPREYEHLFRYVFGRLKIDPTYYPTDDEVINRYRFKNQNGLSGIDYHWIVFATHKVADFARLKTDYDL